MCAGCRAGRCGRASRWARCGRARSSARGERGLRSGTARGLDRMELDDLEVGREVEVARRDDGGQLAPEDGRVRGGTPPEQPIEETPGWWGGRRRRGRGQDREADVLEGPPDDARADDLRREAAPELERAAAEAARDQAHREEVARQVEDVLHVVAQPDLCDHLVQDALEILALEPDRAADAEVEAGILGEGRGEHALEQRLDHHVLGVAPVLGDERLALGGETAQELVADVEDRVRPGALRQVLDDLAHALVAVDQDHVAGADDAQQGVEVVGQEEGVVAARLGERAGGQFEELVAEPAHRWRPL